LNEGLKIFFGETRRLFLAPLVELLCAVHIVIIFLQVFASPFSPFHFYSFHFLPFHFFSSTELTTYLNNLGIAGSAMLYGLTPSTKRGTLGATVPTPGVNTGQAFGIEFVLTFLLVLTVFACTDHKRQHYGYEVPLAIGFCVTVCHLIGVSVESDAAPCQLVSLFDCLQCQLRSVLRPTESILNLGGHSR
jgi:hypothetical protein